MTTTKNFRDLIVWQKAMLLVNKVYIASGHFPDSEKYALISQLRKSAVSIPSNIAESHGRTSAKDHIRYLHCAIGSLYELQTQLEISLIQDYLKKDMFDNLYEDCRDIERMLNTMILNHT